MSAAQDVHFQDFTEGEEEVNLRLPSDTKFKLGDIFLPVSMELGNTSMRIQDILELEFGSIIELERLAGESVELLVNDKVFAQGEVLVVDEHFAIRVTKLITTAEVELKER